MTTYTPGPWNVLPPLGEGDYSIQSKRVNAGGNFYVAVIPNCPHAEAEANARLISAAPELLEALTDLVFIIQSNTHLSGERLQRVSEFKDAIALLAKVEGK